MNLGSLHYTSLTNFGSTKLKLYHDYFALPIAQVVRFSDWNIRPHLRVRSDAYIGKWVTREHYYVWHYYNDYTSGVSCLRWRRCWRRKVRPHVNGADVTPRTPSPEHCVTDSLHTYATNNVNTAICGITRTSACVPVMSRCRSLTRIAPCTTTMIFRVTN